MELGGKSEREGATEIPELKIPALLSLNGEKNGAWDFSTFINQCRSSVCIYCAYCGKCLVTHVDISQGGCQLCFSVRETILH